MPISMRVPGEPILASSIHDLPEHTVAYEPKWDGLRALLVRPAGGRVRLLSRRGTELAGTFPEIAAAAEQQLPADVLLDGEVVLWAQDRLVFDRLLLRLNRKPAAAARLARQTPAHYVAFDLLHRGDNDLQPRSYQRRRAQLEELFASCGLQPPLTLCPMTTDRALAQEWLHQWTLARVGLEGLMVKELSQAYRPGVRGWKKYKIRSSTEAIIAAVTGRVQRPTGLLLGRLDHQGKLRYVGRTTRLDERTARAVAGQMTPAVSEHPWQGRTFTASWGSREPLHAHLVVPELVAEVSADVAVDKGRWRHPVRFLRLRADLAPTDVQRFGTEEEEGS